MISESIKKTFCGDYKSPWNAYRAIYKYTPCGPAIGFRLDGKWLYCSDLPMDPWEKLEKTATIDGVSVSSIVEGSDVEVMGDKLTGDFTPDEFWQLVEAVNDEASFYWDRDNCDHFMLYRLSDMAPVYIKDCWGEITWDHKNTTQGKLRKKVETLIRHMDDNDKDIFLTYGRKRTKFRLYRITPDWEYEPPPKRTPQRRSKRL